MKKNSAAMLLDRLFKRLERFQDLSKSFFYAGVAINLVVVALGVLSLIYAYNHETYLAELRARNLAEAANKMVSAEVDKVDIVVSNVVYELERKLREGPIGVAPTNTFISQQLKSLPEANDVLVANAAGEIFAGTTVSKGAVPSILERDYFAIHRDHPEVGLVVSRPVLSVVIQKWVIPISRRLNAPDGSFAGVVVVPMTVDVFRGLLAKFDLGTNGALSVRTNDDFGLVVRHPEILNGQLSTIGDRLVSAKLGELLKSGGTGASYQAVTSDDRQHGVLGLQHLEKAPFVILVDLASVDYLAQWRLQRNVTILLVLGFVLLSWLGGWILWRSFLRSHHDAERNQLFLRGACDGIHIVDAAGNLVEASDSFAEMLGYSRDEVTGMNVRQWDAKFSPDEVVQAIADHLFSPDKLVFETQHRCKDGRIIDVEITGRSFAMDGSRVLVNSSRDITQRKIAEAELLESKDRLDRMNAELEQRVQQRTQELAQANNLFREAVANIPQGFTIYDQDDRLFLCNETYLRYYETSRDQIVPGNTFEEIVRTGAERGQYEAAIGRVDDWVRYRVSEHQSANGHPIEQKLDDGRWLLIMEFRTPSGYIVGNRIDITELKETQMQLMAARDEADRANQSKSAFLANMSHEIRTPMNAIVGLAELCLSTELSDRQHNYLGKIKGASETLLNIINDILDFSKIEAGKLALESIPFVLENVFDQLSSVVALHAENQGIELSYEIEDDFCPLIGDPLRLTQILTNLVTNALKFSAGGNVLVRTETLRADEQTCEIHFSVSDEGIGMSEVQLEQLFKPFNQADISTTRHYGGSGLGLSICRQLIEMMGGRIWVESELGKGSTFHFTACLKMARPDYRQGIANFAAKLAEYADRPVLVVDDSPIALRITEHLLSQLGLQIETARNAEEALARFTADTAPDYLACLVDWQIPDVDGLEIIRRLREAYAAKRQIAAPMILMTTYSHDELLLDIDHITDGFLAKPVNARHLYVELARCLDVFDDALPKDSWRTSGKVLEWSRFHDLDILVVEDIDLNREVILELLANVGLKARVCNNGAEAIEAIQKQRPDVVLMDCHMPVMDGYAATRKLREQAEYRDLPIIALTANAMLADQEKCFAAGMNAHVSKPIRMESLYESLLKCLPDCQSDQVAGSGHFVGELTEAVALPAFPGIEVALGLANVAGRSALFLRVLKLFRENQGKNFKSQFLEAQAAGNWEAQVYLAHSLKGVAHTLGALDLGETAKALLLAAEARDEGRCAELFAKVAEYLDVVVAGLADLDDLLAPIDPV